MTKRSSVMAKSSSSPVSAGTQPGKGARASEAEVARNTPGPTSYGKSSSNKGSPSKAVGYLNRTDC